MSRLLFTQRLVVQQHDGKGPVYEAGKVYQFDGMVAETYATKYKTRGYAVDAPEGPVATPLAVDPAPESTRLAQEAPIKPTFPSERRPAKRK